VRYVDRPRAERFLNGKGRAEPGRQETPLKEIAGSYSTNTAVPLADTISMLPLSPIAS